MESTNATVTGPLLLGLFPTTIGVSSARRRLRCGLLLRPPSSWRSWRPPPPWRSWHREDLHDGGRQIAHQPLRGAGARRRDRLQRRGWNSGRGHRKRKHEAGEQTGRHERAEPLPHREHHASDLPVPCWPVLMEARVPCQGDLFLTQPTGATRTTRGIELVIMVHSEPHMVPAEPHGISSGIKKSSFFRGLKGLCPHLVRPKLAHASGFGG